MYIEVLGVPVSLTHLAGVEPVSKVEAHRRSVGRIYIMSSGRGWRPSLRRWCDIQPARYSAQRMEMTVGDAQVASRMLYDVLGLVF